MLDALLMISIVMTTDYSQTLLGAYRVEGLPNSIASPRRYVVDRVLTNTK